MADVLNRTTKEYRKSANTPDFPKADWIISPDLSAVAGVPVEHWKITGDAIAPMNKTEIATIDDAILPDEKTNKVAVQGVTAKQLIENRYAYSVLMLLSYMLEQARVDGLSARVKYIEPLFTWMLDVHREYETKKAEIEAQTKRDDVSAFEWDITAIEAADPGITIAGALSVTT